MVWWCAFVAPAALSATAPPGLAVTPAPSFCQGTIDGQLVATAGAWGPVPNGFRLAHQGFRRSRSRSLPRAEATAHGLMPVNTATDTGKKLLCPIARAGGAIAVTSARSQSRAERGVGVGDEEQTCLRAERDGNVKKYHASPGATWRSMR